MAVLSGEEIARQAEAVYAGYTYEVMLLNANGDEYSSATTYNDILADELEIGTGGYQRVTFEYQSSDLSSFADGVFTEERIAVFIHDNSSSIQTFNNVALVRVANGQKQLVGYDYIGRDALFTSGQSVNVRVSILHGEP